MTSNAWLNRKISYKWENRVNSDFIIKILKIKKEDVVLDIGCGMGSHLRDIKRKTGCKCVGVDIRTDLFKLNKDKGIKLKYSDIRDLQIPDSSVTKIFSLGVFEHVPETDKVINEASRVLKDGGMMFFTVPNKTSMFHVTKHVKMIFGLWDLGYEAGFTIKQIEKILRRRGFTMERAIIVPHKRVANIFNLVDNILNKINNSYFGFFIEVLARK